MSPTSGAEERLRALGVALTEPRPAAGNYVGWTRAGSTLYLAGQGADGWVGRVGAELTLAQGQQAARECARNLLAQARAALGSLDRVTRVLRVHGWVACTQGFADLPEVVNGASDLFVEVFGDRGRHARTAVGVLALPRGFAVEVEAVLEVDPAQGPGPYRHAVR